MTADRRFVFLGIIVLLIVVFRLPGSAALTVNAALPITHRVVVQPILVRKTTGETVPGLGNATSETYIKEQINRVWAQAGVRIDWLPFVQYTNNYAYDGSPNNYTSTTRPSGHLDVIVDAASSPKSTDPRVMNMFFVEICPAFNHLGDNYANGLAFIDNNGLTVHVGRSLLNDAGGRDVAAGVIAHEIGHNLGLEHVSQSNNVMASGGTEERLTTAQKTIVFTNGNGADGYELLQPTANNYSQWVAANNVVAGPTGDDDRDGITNVIEYMFNLNPKAKSVLPQPTVSVAGLTWSMVKRPEVVADGLVYRVQTTTNLLTWLPAGTPGSGSTVLQDTPSTLAVRLNAGAGKAFMRLSIAVPTGL